MEEPDDYEGGMMANPQGEQEARIRSVAQQLIDGYDEIDFDPVAVATDLVGRYGFADLDEWLRTLPPGQFAYSSVVTDHMFSPRSGVELEHNTDTEEDEDRAENEDEYCWVCADDGHSPSESCQRAAGMID